MTTRPVPPPPMTAREILGLRRDFTPDQLKANFKALALHLHPDKTVLPMSEANVLMHRLIQAYQELRDGAAAQSQSGAIANTAGGEGQARQFHELRGGSAPTTTAPPARTGRNSPSPSTSSADEKMRSVAAASLGGRQPGDFDISRFNTVFERTRVRDASVDDGYTKWMDKVTPESIAASQAKKSAGASIQAYAEPAPLVSCRGLSYAEIGLAKTHDYGRGCETVGQGHSLGFTDYRSAHSTDSRVIDPATARPRAAFNNMLELETARASPAAAMSPEEQRAHATHARHTADSDARRQRTLRRQAVAGREHQAAVMAALLALEE